jgi:hypothetical protein
MLRHFVDGHSVSEFKRYNREVRETRYLLAAFHPGIEMMDGRHDIMLRLVGQGKGLNEILKVTISQILDIAIQKEVLSMAEVGLDVLSRSGADSIKMIPHPLIAHVRESEGVVLFVVSDIVGVFIGLEPDTGQEPLCLIILFEPLEQLPELCNMPGRSHFGMFGAGEAIAVIVNESAATDRTFLVGIDSTEHTHSPSRGFYAVFRRECQHDLFDLHFDRVNVHYLLALKLPQGGVEALDVNEMNCSVRPKFDKIDNEAHVPRKMKRSLS